MLAMLLTAATMFHGTFHAEVSGQGPAMIFIPGLSSAGEVWDGVVAHEKAHHQCHVLTLAGFAGLPAIAPPFLKTVRTELAAYIREHKLEKPVIVGHSLGGFLALMLAEEEPALVGPVVIVDSLPFLPAAQYPGATVESSRPYAEQMKAMLAAQSPEQRKAQLRATLHSMITDPKQVERAAQWGDASDPAAVGNAMAELMTTDLRPGLAKVKSRTLVVGSWIGLKGMVTREQMEATYRGQYDGLPGVKVVMHPTAKHFIMLDDLQGLLTEVDGFLR